MVAFLVMETFMVGVFCALDLVLFYLFFEGILIPMFLIIGIWGGPRRIYSAFKFFLYTLARLGAVPGRGPGHVPARPARPTSRALMTAHFDPILQRWLWLAMFASFAIKVPMWPFHTWLPDAHVEAPTAGSVVLAGILLKLGGYGFLRFSLPMLPDASAFFTPLIYALSVVAIVYTSLVALMQSDMKKLIAYSSVAHMGIVTIGIFTLNPLGIQGCDHPDAEPRPGLGRTVHGASAWSTTRIHTREIATYGGLVERMPLYATVFMLFMLASIGLPGTSGFVGEILVLIGVFQVDSWVAALAATGMILGAAYMLWVYRRVIFGALRPGASEDDPRSAAARGRGLRAARCPGAAHGRLSRRCSSIPMAASVDHLLAQVARQPAATRPPYWRRAEARPRLENGHVRPRRPRSPRSSSPTRRSPS